ncbi:GMC oxidoreductase-domain-containing protein [Schizophyllum amplum]|uniref:GMC oxidoreductase-domain-containing protein n=1 Tax=Schizophyllum amplum TaxID=97359 RepID=A0A550CHW1_9AGAR|nr:GMC oxidoreductase-domain-containing protein [Auriculariopsis ampla]
MAPAQYDIIFAGGGCAACVAAGRLAAADPSLKILILEAGEHTKDLDAHIQPFRYFSHLAPTSKTVTFNAGKPSPTIGNRSIITPSGRCLGGGSSVNFTMYNRAAASDFDDWKNVYKNPGWGCDDLLPLLKKMETYQEEPDRPTHGYDGPLKVSYGGMYMNVGKQFLETSLAYDKERGPIDDVNGLYKCNGYGRWAKFVDQKTGRRSDVPHHYIYNQAHNKNLVIETGQRVKKVLFEGDKAVGVEYVADTVLRPNADQTVKSAYAGRLVVVAAGAFGSPTILERSGVGNAKILEKLGIKVKVDLPGVGENYQDHNVVFVPYHASDDADTMDALFRSEKAEVEKWNKKWLEEGKGLIAHNGIDAGIKMRPTEAELKALGTPFEERWKTFFEKAEDKPVIWVGAVAAFLGDITVAPPVKYYSVGFYTQYPVSRGSVHITDAEDANALHDFDAGFLTDQREADVSTLVWGYKKSREIARRMPVYRGEYLPANPRFAAGSAAECKETAKGPVAVDAPEIKYSDEDEKEVERYVRNFVQTAWHSLGTCAMMPREKKGVVDSKLNVYGTKNLKVCDISIAPANVGANTYSTALTIGEKSAVIIAEELGIKL